MINPLLDDYKLVTDATVTEQGVNNAKPEFIQKKSRSLRKFALRFGYTGDIFNGLQYQSEGGVERKDSYTVEGCLEKALLQMKTHYEDLQFPDNSLVEHTSWSRAARTDKGVHAACQVVSFRLLVTDHQQIMNYVKPFIQLMNSVLPPQIHAYDLTRVQKYFNARFLCTQRHYEYVMPLTVLAPVEINSEYLDAYNAILKDYLHDNEVENLEPLLKKRRKDQPPVMENLKKKILEYN